MSGVFGKLKEHSMKMESAIRDLESDLQAKLRRILSVGRYSVPEESVVRVGGLIEEMRALDREVAAARAALEKDNRRAREDNAQNQDILDLLSDQLQQMEIHLQEYGYTPDTHQ